MSYGFNIVSVTVIPSKPVSLNVAIFAGTAPSVTPQYTGLGSGAAGYSMFNTGSVRVTTPVVTPAMSVAPKISTAQAAAITVLARSSGYQVYNRLPANNLMIAQTVAAAPQTFIPVLFGSKETVSFVVTNIVLLNITQLTVTLPAPSKIPFVQITSSKDVSVVSGTFVGKNIGVGIAPASMSAVLSTIPTTTPVTIQTVNKVTQANYSFVTSATTSTYVSVALPDYSVLGTTYQQKLGAYALATMYVPAPASASTGASTGAINIVSATSAALNIGSCYNTSGYGVGTSGVIVPVPILQATTAPAAKFLSTKFGSALSQATVTALPTTTLSVETARTPPSRAVSITGFVVNIQSNYSLFNTSQPTVRLISISLGIADTTGVFQFSAASNRPAAYTYTVMNTNTVLVRTSTVVNSVNYISVNVAGINTISTYVYEPVYGGLTPPISSSGQFGGVQTGVIGYQYWS